MSDDMQQYRDELKRQQNASKELGNNVDWNPHLKLPPGAVMFKVSKPAILKLNFFRYKKTIPGGFFNGMEFAAFREYGVHEVGPMKTKVLCPYETYGQPCTMCARKNAAFRNSSLNKQEKFDAAQPYFTTKRRLYNLADAEVDPQTIMIYDVVMNCLPETLDAKIEMSDEAMLGWNSAKHGKTLVITFDEFSSGGDRRPYRKAVGIEVVPRIGKYGPDILNKIYDLDSILVPLDDAAIMKMFDEGASPDNVDTKDEYASGGTVKISSEQKELDEWAAGETGGDETPSDEPEATVEPEAAPFDDEPEAAAEPVQEKAVAKKTTAAPAKTETKAATKAAPKKETKAESKVDDPGWD